MNKGYSHIFRSAIVSFLMAGFLAHLLMPLSSHAQKTAFTRWLDHNVVSTGDDNEIKLRNTIRQLPEKTSNLRILIQEASELVSNHKEDFRLIVKLPESSDNQITSWLVGQWNVFQHQKTGTNALLPDANQSIQKWITPNYFSKTILSAASSIRLFSERISEIHNVINASLKALPPLASGISINAP
jgi:hypothetical protein